MLLSNDNALVMPLEKAIETVDRIRETDHEWHYEVDPNPAGDRARIKVFDANGEFFGYL